MYATVDRWWHAFRDAAGFLTRLPSRPAEPAAGSGFLVGCIGMFPAVGAVVGAMAALVLLAAVALGLPPAVAALSALAAMTLITGALHEDGLADFADGLGGGACRDDKLRIMADSRIGTYGVLAVAFAVGLRAAALVSLADGSNAAAGALIAAAALSRATLAAMLRALAPARPSGLSAAAGQPPRAEVVKASAIGIGVAFLALSPNAAVAAVVAAAAGAGAVAWLTRRHLGGHTGDALGAAQQAAETAALLAVAAAP